MADSVAFSIRIPATGYSHLAAVAEHADRLTEVVAALEKSPILTDVPALATHIAEMTGVSEPTTRDILNGLATLHGLMIRANATAEGLVSGVEAAIDTQAPPRWRERLQEKWKNAKSRVTDALNEMSPESPLFVQQKARELTYAHQNLLIDTALITDLRPIYNTAGDKILATVLTHVMSITYSDGETTKRIEFALDAADVAKIGQIVERAQIKTATARKLADSSQFHLLVPGAIPLE